MGVLVSAAHQVPTIIRRGIGPGLRHMRRRDEELRRVGLAWWSRELAGGRSLVCGVVLRRIYGITTPSAMVTK
jgi:hypothetical protein